MDKQHVHTLRVVRTRGNRVRKQCTSCLQFTKWKRDHPGPKQLMSLSVSDLRAMARTNHIRGYSAMRKDELIQALTEVRPAS